MPSLNVPEDTEPIYANEATEDVETGHEDSANQVSEVEKRMSSRTERDREFRNSLHDPIG